MAATMQTTFTETDVVAEIDDERASLVQALTVALPLLGWLWLYYSLTRNWSPLEPSVPMLVLCGAAYGAHRLRQTRLDAACRLIVAGMVIALCSVVYAHPAILTMTFGVLGVIMANALLGARDAALTAAVTAALGAAAYRNRHGQPVSTGRRGGGAGPLCPGRRGDVAGVPAAAELGGIGAHRLGPRS